MLQKPVRISHLYFHSITNYILQYSPGSRYRLLHFYNADYDWALKVSRGMKTSFEIIFRCFRTNQLVSAFKSLRKNKMHWNCQSFMNWGTFMIQIFPVFAIMYCSNRCVCCQTEIKLLILNFLNTAAVSDHH